MIGKVVAVGPNEKKWKAGDRAGGGWHGGHDGNNPGLQIDYKSKSS